MRAIGFLVGLAIILFVGVVAVTNNQQEVTVTYFFGRSWTGRLWISLLASFGAGAVVALLFASFFMIREKVRSSMLSRKVSKLEEEVKSLKQRPMPDEHPVFPAVASSALPAKSGQV